MKAYMKDQFPYLGLSRPVRDELQRDFIKQKVKQPPIDWAWITATYGQPEREFQYLAIDYLRKMEKKLQPGDLATLKNLICTKSWWDTVDSVSMSVGTLAMRHPEVKRKLAEWMEDDSRWVRRSAIIHQLKHRGKTDTSFLTDAIVKNLGSRDFFINKAIGWALREYSKTDPAWVRKFMASHTLAPLSIREGSKYL